MSSYTTGDGINLHYDTIPGDLSLKGIKKISVIADLRVWFTQPCYVDIQGHKKIISGVSNAIIYAPNEGWTFQNCKGSIVIGDLSNVETELETSHPLFTQVIATKHKLEVSTKTKTLVEKSKDLIASDIEEYLQHKLDSIKWDSKDVKNQVDSAYAQMEKIIATCNAFSEGKVADKKQHDWSATLKKVAAQKHGSDKNQVLKFDLLEAICDNAGMDVKTAYNLVRLHDYDSDKTALVVMCAKSVFYKDQDYSSLASLCKYDDDRVEIAEILKDANTKVDLNKIKAMLTYSSNRDKIDAIAATITVKSEIKDDSGFNWTLIEKEVAKKSFDSGRNEVLETGILKAVSAGAKISANSAQRIIKCYSFDSGRIDAVKLLVQYNVLDPKQDYSSLVDLCSFRSGKAEMVSILKN